MESHQMQQIEQMKNNLKELLKQLKNAGEKYQLLEQIIQININMENKTNSHRNIQESLINSLHVNPFLLFSYIQFPLFFQITDLNLNVQEYKRVLELVNNIKIKYGVILKNILSASKDPFLITGVETSISNGESSHTIRFIRGDGEVLEGIFKPKNLLPLISGLIGAIKMSMENGIYNIDRQAIDQYLSESEGFRDYLIKLLNRENDEQ